MATPRIPWQPRYTLTPTVARCLMEIEAARAVVEHTPLTPAARDELRRRARLRSTHYSTRIEGNRLTLAEAQRVIEGQETQFHGRERDVRTVQQSLCSDSHCGFRRMPAPDFLKIQGIARHDKAAVIG